MGNMGSFICEQGHIACIACDYGSKVWVVFHKIGFKIKIKSVYRGVNIYVNFLRFLKVFVLKYLEFFIFEQADYVPGFVDLVLMEGQVADDGLEHKGFYLGDFQLIFMEISLVYGQLVVDQAQSYQVVMLVIVYGENMKFFIRFYLVLSGQFILSLIIIIILGYSSFFFLLLLFRVILKFFFRISLREVDFGFASSSMFQSSGVDVYSETIVLDLFENFFCSFFIVVEQVFLFIFYNSLIVLQLPYVY